MIEITKKEGNYSQKLLTLAQTTYDAYKGLYGDERIMGQIYIDTGKLFNIKTIYRYMRHLGIEVKIRNPNKRRRNAKKEIKNTKDIRTNYILGNFKNDSSW